MTARTIRLDALAGTTALSLALLASCSAPKAEPADLVLHNAHAYTLAWSDPSGEGVPASGAPFDSSGGWHHDATAVAVRGGRIVFVGSDSGALALRGDRTRVMDLGGATLLRGFVDAYTHVAELGQSLDRVNLTGIATEAEAVAKVEERARTTP